MEDLRNWFETTFREKAEQPYSEMSDSMVYFLLLRYLLLL